MPVSRMIGGPDAAVLCDGMRAVDPDVLVGRNPAWKEAWEEDLNDEQDDRYVRPHCAGDAWTIPTSSLTSPGSSLKRGGAFAGA